jgi:hypothetical protein
MSWLLTIPKSRIININSTARDPTANIKLWYHTVNQYVTRVDFQFSRVGSMNGDNQMELGQRRFQGSKLLVAKGGVGIGIAPLELVTCSHVFSPQLPLNQTCKLSSPNKYAYAVIS